MNVHFALLLAVFVAATLFAGCTSRPHSLGDAMASLESRPAWDEHPEPDYPRHPAEKFLANWTIVLDPGHGGDAHLPGFKRGPTGVREAEINWRVAVLLRTLLEQAGAHVALSRDGDEEVNHEQRARLANTIERRRDGGRGADLFISLHHNASSTPTSNYTSVWFHGTPDMSEPDLDPARYIAHHLGRALRTQVAVTSPLMSDQQMYDSGFAVLRMTQVPAVLVESSFHSHPQEEQRLTDAAYNLREAYAIYEALCEYAYGGRPTQSSLHVHLQQDDIIVETTLDDGLPPGWWGGDRPRIVASTVTARLAGYPMQIKFDPATRQLRATLPRHVLPDVDEEHPDWELTLHHANLFKHHNWPQRYQVTLEGGQPTVSPLGSRRLAP